MRDAAGPADAAARAGALLARGFPEAAAAAFDRALGAGASDPTVLAAVLRHHPDPGRRAEAARLMLASDRSGDADRAAAAALLLAARDEILLHGRRVGPRVSGWMATRPGPPPRLRLRTGSGAVVDLAPVPAAGSGPALSWWRFAQELAEDGPVLLLAASGPDRWAAATLPASPWSGPRRAARPAAAPDAEPRPLAVVVPVYGDPDSLAACLESLARQELPDLRVVIVDDAAPDPAVVRLAQDFCRHPGRLYRRHALNGGFAAAVNLGLSLCPDHDALLLNSDVVLPEGALARLRDAARSAPGVGILAPLSNDAGNSTFPDAAAPAPPLPAAAAAAVDGAARALHGGRLVDMPSVLGSCLYITAACRDAVGPLSLAFGRGYFEDVDLCLRAREQGFRVAVLCDTYVSHHSGRSFGAQRARLVTHNMGVLDGRFPDHAALDAASDAADPLRPVRAAIERALVPSGGPWRLLVGRAATAGPAMAARRQDLGPEVKTLHLAWARAGEGWRLALAGDGGPRSLEALLGPAGDGGLGAWLSRLAVDRVEIFEPAALPDPLWRWLADLGPPLVLVPDGRAEAEAARSIAARLAGRDVAVLPLDGATAADRRSLSRPAGRAVRRLGLPLPRFSAAAERLVAGLAARMPDRDLVVLGETFGLSHAGRIAVTGPVPAGELEAALRHYEVEALFLPYRDGLRWILDRAGAGLPQAFFDVPPAGRPAVPGDLALPAAASDRDVCHRLDAWCRGEAA